MLPGVEHLQQGRLRRLGLFSLGKGRLQRDLMSGLSVSSGGYRKVGAGTSAGSVVIGQGETGSS